MSIGRALLSERAGSPLFTILETFRSITPAFRRFHKGKKTILVEAHCHGWVKITGFK